MFFFTNKQVSFGPKALFSLFLRMEKVPLVAGARRLIANAFFLLQNIEVLQLNIIVFMPFILTGDLRWQVYHHRSSKWLMICYIYC